MERKKLLILLIIIFFVICLILSIVLINSSKSSKKSLNEVVTQNDNKITVFENKTNEVNLEIREEYTEHGVKYYDQFNEEIKQF